MPKGDNIKVPPDGSNQSSSDFGSINNASPTLSISKTLMISAILASLGSFNFGYNLAAVNTPALTFRNCPKDSSIWQCFPVSFEQWGYVVAIMCAGAIVGSLSAGPLANSWGRKHIILAANIPYILGLLLMTFSLNLPMLLVGRIFIGIGVGMACIAVPLYLTEISHVTSRGFIGSMHQLMICIGFLSAEILGYLGLYRPYYWRLMFAIDLLVCLFQIVGMMFASPESPRFLLLNEKVQEGEESLRTLRGVDYKMEELENIAKETEESRNTQAWSLTDLFKNYRVSFKSLFIAGFLHVGQQVSGINSILLFSSSIFASPESSNDSPSLAPLLIGIINLLMTFAAIAVIDRAGRRFLAISSSGVMFLSSLLLTYGFLKSNRVLSIVAVLFFVGSFAFGMGPIPWLMTNELFPTYAAGVAVSIAVCLNWISNLAVTATFPRLLVSLGIFSFLPYAIFILIFFLFTVFILPETKGRSVGFV